MMPGERVFLTMEYAEDNGELVLSDIRERRLCLIVGEAEESKKQDVEEE